MTFRSLAFSLLLFCLVDQSLQAVASAPLRFSRYGLAEGLSQNSVTSIVQDAQGFLWVGTQDGLNRFDGYNFRVFQHQPGDDLSLSNSYVNALMLARNGDLWVGTFNGLNRYDQHRERFEKLPLPRRENNPPAQDLVRCLLEDRSGFIWLGTVYGLLRFDPVDQSFHTIFQPESSPEADVETLAEDDRGRIWIGTRKGLRVLEPESGRLYWVDELYSGLDFLRAARILSLLVDAEKRVWIGTIDRGAYFIDPEKQVWQSLRSGKASMLSYDQINSLAQDKAGNYWIGTRDSLLVMDRNLEFVEISRHHTDDAYSLSQNTVNSFFQDAGGQIWLGTMGGGLNRHDPGTRVFSHWRSRAADAHSLGHRVIYSMFVDSRETLWLGTLEGGLNFYDRKSGRFSAFVHDPARLDSISSNHVVAIAEGLDGVLWVATSNAGLNRLDPSSGRFTRIGGPESEGPLSSERLRALAVDRRGRVWIGTSGAGLDCYDPASGRVLNFKNDPQDPASLSSDFVRGLYLDRSGDLWVATYGRGINRLRIEDLSITSWVHDPHDFTSLSSDLVRSISQDSRGRFWVATDLGVNLFDPEKDGFTRYDTRHGLPSNVVYGVLEDRGGLLWMSTNNGITRLDPDSGRFSNFDQDDGLQSKEFNTGAFCRDSSGRLYFGGQNGYNVFDPDAVKPNQFLPPVVLTELLVFNEVVPVAEDQILPVSLPYTSEIRFSRGQRIITLEFSGLSFSQAHKNRYAFKLEGFHDRWIETSARQRQATFTGLAPDRYFFRVRAANNDGIWNEKETGISLIIVPAFWQTTWFRILVFAGMAGMIIGVFAWRQSDLRRRNLFLERTVRERTEEILSQKGEIEEKSHELEIRLQELECSIAQIKKLEGLLPICCSCKKIRLKEEDSKKQQSWVEVEDYIAERTDADFSHGICPQCAEELYPKTGKKKA